MLTMGTASNFKFKPTFEEGRGLEGESKVLMCTWAISHPEPYSETLVRPRAYMFGTWHSTVLFCTYVVFANMQEWITHKTLITRTFLFTRILLPLPVLLIRPTHEQRKILLMAVFALPCWGTLISEYQLFTLFSVVKDGKEKNPLYKANHVNL